MANSKQLEPRLGYQTMSNQNYQNMLAGGNLEKPLYEFDANGNMIFHEENVQYYSPSVMFKNPMTGRTESATTLMDYMKNQDEHLSSIKQTYNALLKYDHEYNVDAGALQAIKAIPTFISETALTAGETLSTITNAVHSVPRTINEAAWNKATSLASKQAKDEMWQVLGKLPNDDAVNAHVKAHDWLHDETISDETRRLILAYKDLLYSRENDELWSNTIGNIFSQSREQVAKDIHGDSMGNKYQNLQKIAQFSGNIAGSLGVFKYGAMAARLATANRIGVALTKTFGVTGESAAVFGLSFSNQYDSLRREGLMKGLSYTEAMTMAFLGGAAEAFIEAEGMSRFGRLSTKRSIMNVIKADMFPEAGEELLQTLTENAFTKIYGINDKTFADIVEESVLAGLGGALGGLGVGMVDYASGQYATRVQAAKEIREQMEREAYERAQKKNEKALIEFRKKASYKSDGSDGGPTAPGAAALPVVQGSNAEVNKPTAQQDEAIEEAQIISAEEENAIKNEVEGTIQISMDEKQFLLSHDAEYAQELANADANFRNTLKTLLSEKLKKINPKITDKQIENATALLFRVSNKLDRDDTFSASVSQWADDIVKWSNEKAPQYTGNLAILDQKLGMASLGLTPEDISDLKSGDRFKRHAAEWKLTKLSIKQELARNGVNETYAQKMADTFEQTFATSALLSNVSPTQLLHKLTPRIINLSRASINNQEIAGYQGTLDNIIQSRKETANLRRTEAENIINSLEARGNDEETKNMQELALSEIIGDMDSKKSVSRNDMLNALTNRAKMERMMAQEMGIAEGNDLGFKDYKTMALMRAKGATQDQINEAFSIQTENDANAEFVKARQKLFPELDPEEKAEIEKLLAQVNAEKPNSNVKAFYAEETQENLAKAENDSNIGGTLVLGSDFTNDIAAEEFFHSISTKLEEAAQYESVKDSGGRYFGAYKLYSVGLLPETRPLAKLFNSLTGPLDGIEMTDRQKHETVAEAFVRHIKLEMMEEDQKAALNEYESETNDIIATAEDSKYSQLSDYQKTMLTERFNNLLKPDTTAQLIAVGNKLTNLAKGFDVLEAQKLALDTLTKYQVYNDGQWTYLLTQLNNMAPEQQLSVLSDFGVNLIQQGYDLLVADTYDIEMEDGRQVLVKNPELAEKVGEGSYLSDRGDKAKIYFHAESTKSIERKKYKKKFWSRVTDFLGNAKDDLESGIYQNYIETLSHSAFAADPVIGSVLRRNMYNYSKNEIALMKLAGEIPQLAERLKIDYSESPEKRAEFQVRFKDALLAGNEGARLKARLWIMDQFSGTGYRAHVGEVMTEIYNTLDRLRAELIRVGVPMGFVKNYWPRYVKDRDGLAKYLGYEGHSTQTEKMIRNLMEKLKKNYNKASMEELRAMAIDAINRQWHKYQDGDEDVTAFHHRGDTYNHDVGEFYDDPFESLARYFEQANRTLLMRRLTGRVIPSLENKDEYITNFDKAVVIYQGKHTRASFNARETGQLGKAFAIAISNKNPNMKALDNFAKQMKKFVNRTSYNESDFAKFWQRTNAMLLGNFNSMLNQYMELPLVLKNYGLTITNQAMKEAIDEMLDDLKKSGVDLESINVQPLQEIIRYKDNDLLSKVTDIAHTISGFKYSDILLKNIEIKAALKGAQAVLDNPDVNDIKYKRFLRDFNNTFPDKIYDEKTRQEIIGDIKANNMSENVKFFLFNHLSNMQPINAAEVPSGYNAAGPAGRLIYQYRTTTMRQLETLVSDLIWGFKELPLKDALKNLLYSMIYFIAIGIPVAALQDLLRGRKPDPAEAALYSPLQLLSINEYTINSIQQKGLIRGLTTELAPSFRVVDDVSKDFMRLISFKSYQSNTVRDVPVAGPLMYYWLLGGRDHNIRHKEAIGISLEDNERYDNALKSIVGGAL